MLLIGNDGECYTLRDSSGNDVHVGKEELIKLVKCHCISNARMQGTGITKCDSEIKIRNMRGEDKDKLTTYLKVTCGTDAFIDKLETSKAKICLYGNKYECVFMWDKVGRVHVFFDMSFPNMELSISEYISALSKQVNNCVFGIRNYCKLPCTFSNVDMTSSLDNNYKYITGFVFVTEYDGNKFKKEYEKRLFGDIKGFDLSKVSYKCIGNAQYKQYISNLYDTKRNWEAIDWIDKFNNKSLAGFRYLKSLSIHPNKKYLCAIYDNRIIGVIGFVEWRNYGYQLVAYVDVCKPYRNKGLANELIKQLNSYLDKSLPLVLTELSEMGERARMDLAFKNKIKAVKVYTYKEALDKNKEFKG